MNGYTNGLAVLDYASTLSDATRCRLLRLLEEQELTVSELCSVLQLPQSTVSRHLRILSEGDWVKSRRDGTSHLYRVAEPAPAAGRMWQVIREQIAADSLIRQDGQRLASVLAERLSRSEAFFATTAGKWDRLRDELFGDRFDLLTLPWLLDPEWTVGDLACGTGRVAGAVAPAVRQVIAIDQSAAMLAAARERLVSHDNVAVREGKLEALPLADASLDAATLFLALHLTSDPGAVLAEAFRTLKPGGRLLVVDLVPHEREALRQEMGHVWLGFSPAQVTTLAERAGFRAVRYSSLPPAADAKGPPLFVAGAQRPAVDPN